MSNKKKLLDHVELVAEEVRAFIAGDELRPFDERDRYFHEAWAAFRGYSAPAQVVEAARLSMTTCKRDAREWLRTLRRVFGTQFRVLRDAGLPYEWRHCLHELEEEGYVARMILQLIESEDLPRGITGDDVLTLPYRDLPATASWAQYYIALGYLAAHESGRLAKPDFGDQVDQRHACYTGIADVFVTGDERMAWILDNMVESKVAAVMTPITFADWLRQNR